MSKEIKKIDYAEFISNACPEQQKIGDDIFLLDDYSLNPVCDCDFIAKGNTVIDIIEGEGYVDVNSVRHDVKGPCLLIYLDGQQIRTSITSERSVQRSAVFSDKFLEELNMSGLKFNDIRSTVINNPVIALNDEALKAMSLYIFNLRQIAKSPDMPNAVQCAKFITLALFYGPLFYAFKKKIESETFRSPKIASDFFALLEKHFKEEHRIVWYADKLNISERYLYSAILTSTGKTPSYWISYYIFSEAKKLLANRDLTIQQVCFLLNFSGMPSFCKFFTRNAGMTPSAFRKSISSPNK